MNAPRLYIHIGTHKTGSTAIQHALSQNRVALRNQGIVYLLYPVAAGRLEASKELDDQIISQCKNDLDRSIRGNPRNKNTRYLWSWEGFSGDPATGFKNANIVAESLRKVTASLDTHIIVYLRRQDDFLESWYSQMMRAGQEYTFDSFLENYSSSSFDWHWLLECYSEHFGKDKIIARRYDKKFLPERDSLFKDFASNIGIDSNSLVPHPDAATPNTGYSRDAAEIARIANPYLDSNEKTRLREILHQTSSKQPFESYSFWDYEKRKEIVARYTESNAIVAREYFNEPSGVLFPFEPALYAHQLAYPGISLESTVALLAKGVVAQQETRTESTLLRALSRFDQKVRESIVKWPWLASKLKYVGQKSGLLH